MGTDAGRCRIAVVSPFVDKRHGTERCVAEQVERLAENYEIHLFSSRVEDISPSHFVWHRVPEIPGPHLVKYMWWFVANHAWRWAECVRSGGKFRVVFSPGINCFDANVILIHHVFADQRGRLRERLRFRSHPLRQWPRLVHRRLFYGLIGLLEGVVYRRRQTALSAISRSVAADVERRFRPGEAVATIYHGVDCVAFNPDARQGRRKQARQKFGYREEDFIVLLIGNDWEKKGLFCLIASLAKISDLRISALIAGKDSPERYADQARRLGIGHRLRFAGVSPDVLQFYAAADVCAAPSVYDPFGLPVLEAMACGMPVIASKAMGASELVADGENGLILEDPQDAAALSRLIRRLYDEGELRHRLGTAAAAAARHFTWEANAAAVAQQFERVLKPSGRSEEVAARKA